MMRVFSILHLSLVAILLSGNTTNAQTSFLMTFTTSGNGSRKTETNTTQNSQTSFFGISIETKDLQQQQPFLNEVDRQKSESYIHASETVTFLNTEQGRAVQQTQVQSSIEYDFVDYEFTHSLDFDY